MSLITTGLAAAHTLAVTVWGGALVIGVYRWLGLRFHSKSGFNPELLQALILIEVGVISLLAVR